VGQCHLNNTLESSGWVMAVVAAASMFAHSREQGKLASSIYMWFKTLHSNHFYFLSKVKYKRLFLIMNLADEEGMRRKQQTAEWLTGVGPCF
jgi:TRAP-type C4-dicarboxylate transport system permease large subunit